MKRTSDHPVSASITRRRLLAQEVRNDLAAYRALTRSGTGGDLGSPQRDVILNRVHWRFDELLKLEGLER